jgi:hypothetical protein
VSKLLVGFFVRDYFISSLSRHEFHRSVQKFNFQLLWLLIYSLPISCISLVLLSNGLSRSSKRDLLLIFSKKWTRVWSFGWWNRFSKARSFPRVFLSLEVTTDNKCWHAAVEFCIQYQPRHRNSGTLTDWMWKYVCISTTSASVPTGSVSQLLCTVVHDVCTTESHSICPSVL